MADDASGKLSRRGLLGVGAGAAAAALALPNLACGGGGDQGTDAAKSQSGGALIPQDRRGIQLYTVRDAVGRDPHEYPTLPAGFRQVFAALAAAGYGTIEGFNDEGAPFRQHQDSEGGAEPSPRLVKRWLDEYGLRAAGHYGRIDPRTIEATLRLAETLGISIIGSVDPIPWPCSNQKDAWDRAIGEWNQCTPKAQAAGIRLYAHAHWRPWDFLRDSGKRNANGEYDRCSGVRSMDYWLTNTDPKWATLELDTYWAYVARDLYKTYTRPDGSTGHDEFDPIATALRYGKRVTFFHAKDGVRAAKPPAGFEGNWVWTTFNSGDMPVEELFRKVMKQRSPADAPYVNIEQDNAVAGEGHSLAEPFSDPAKSLRDARTDYLALAALKA
ncbi:MAG TPA: sugar phosphate isomerase/epimerase [Solirubrobacterales bacterium]|jgi:sugar phosphate isomerase/epimerase|nr:sugar phosphate isomerase/epimerase [Solirubrobacterales bacterium]